ncbi:TauD/TfdA family dioxygenase [Pararhizobium sp. LjRoot235]|uniref:TauD/TfdA family dioxygenase n=1 Tax=Pararhizobium sp. LjRoot235 TaxID=3342291 RepID=UPI003ED0719E
MNAQSRQNFAFTQLKSKGWVHLKEAGGEVFENLTSNLAHKLYDSDVKLDPRFTHRVTKPEAIPYHCDSPRARYIAWLCLNSGKSPVPLKLVDAHGVAQLLPDEAVRRLALTRLGFNCRVHNHLCSMPVLSSPELADDTLVFFNPWNIPKNLTGEHRDALRSFEERLNQADHAEIDFSVGDILIVNNHRVVHGRDALKGDTDRHLLRRLMEDPALALPIRKVRQANVVPIH